MQRVYSVCSPKPTNDQLALQETVFHNANGYLGVRGTLEEGAPQGMDTMRGAYVNGFYEIVPMKQAEKLTHVREDKESMINVADVQGIRFRLAGEWFSQWTGTLVESERRLDMDRGITERRVRWRSPEGRETALCFRRMASFAEPSLFLIDCEVTPLNYEGEVEVESTHLALVKNYANPNDPRLAGESECHLVPDGSLIEEEASYLSTRTRVSGLSLTTGVKHALEPAAQNAQTVYDPAAHAAAFHASVTVRQGQTLRLQKYCVFSDERRHGDTLAAARRAMAGAFGRADELYRAQQETLSAFWESADTTILGDDDANLSMQFNLYQLFQSAGRDGLCSIAAKGLSGEGYEGHYFWDTEMYMMTFFTLTMPQLARKLLGYRYRTLDAARENARLLGHRKGALYPWRTIAGRECSGYFLAGTAQYHIVGDIAYAVGMYYNATGDREYLISEGAELLLETARLWMDVGHVAEGTFRINCVTGPDEYTCLVNNNYYTNACAKTTWSWRCGRRICWKSGAHMASGQPAWALPMRSWMRLPMPRKSCICLMTKRWASIRRMIAFCKSRYGTWLRRRVKISRCCSIIIPCSCTAIRYANRRIPCWHMCFLKAWPMRGYGNGPSGTMRRLRRTTLLCPIASFALMPAAWVCAGRHAPILATA